MSDYTHKTGEWMISYRYGFMKMDGNGYSFTVGWQMSI